MNKNKIFLISILLLLSLLIEGFISGCAKKENNEENSGDKSGSKKEVPKAINNIEDNIKEIFKELKIYKESQGSQSGEENNNKEKSQNGKENSSDSECSEDSKESNSENNESKNEGQNSSNTEGQEDKKWTAIDKKILTLHENWNSLQPEAIKSGVSRERIDSFSNTLNNLTTECNNKNTENTKMYSIELFGNMANFLDYYKSNPPPDLKRIEYHTMNIKYKSINGNWDNAISDI